MANIVSPSISGSGVGQPAEISFGMWDTSVVAFKADILNDGSVWMANVLEGATLVWTQAENGRTFILRVMATLSNGDEALAYSAPVTVGYAPPVSAGLLMDEVLDLGSGDFIIDASIDFTGVGLTFTISGAGASIDSQTGTVTIPTDVELAGAVVTVTATNAGGSANSSFLVTVEPHVANSSLKIFDDDWDVSGPRSDGFDVVFFNVPQDPLDPVSDLQFSIDGGGWQSLGASVPGVYRVSGLERDTGYSISVRAIGKGSGAGSDWKWLATIPEDPAGFRGWNSSLDLGKAGNFFVAPYGDDSATGTEADPFLTIGRAVSAASSGHKIKVRAGTYRETVNLKAGVGIEGYGQEKPQITAAERLVGLTQCAPVDAGVLGPALGVADSPVFKTVIAKSEIQYTDINAVNVFEAGRRTHLSSDRADTSSLHRRDDEQTFHVADQFVLNSANQITEIVDLSVLNNARYTNAQLVGKEVLLYHYPNVVSSVRIESADVDNGRVSVSGLKVVEGNRSNPAPDVFRYAITNVAPALTPGTHFVRDIGSNIEVYVYPRSQAHLMSFEYSARVAVMNFPPPPGGDIAIRGLHVSRATGEGYAQGSNILKSVMGAHSGNNQIEHVLSTGTLNTGDISRSFFFRGMSDTAVSNCSFFDIPGRGVWFAGMGVDNRGVRNMVKRSSFIRIAGAPFFVYSQDQMVFAHNYADQTGWAAHSNKSNAYEQVNGVLWWGNEWGRDTNGYLTWQEASSPIVAFNLIPISSKYLRDNRAIVDQQNPTAPPVPGTTGFIFNNTIPPQAGNSGAWGHLSIDLFQNISDINYWVVNNVAHGITAPAQFPTSAAVVKSNLITKLGWDGVKQTAQSDYDATNMVVVDVEQVYSDFAADNFSPAPASPMLQLPGQDLTDMVVSMHALFPQFHDWGKDYRDQTIDWARLPIGADAGLQFTRS